MLNIECAAKRHLLTLALVAGATLSALPARGGAVPTGYQEYFIIGWEQHVYGMMDRVRLGEGTAGGGFANINNSVVSFVASSDGQRIYYDHWEDGLEADVLSPGQAATLVFGDGNAANGRACDWTTDPRVVCGSGTEDLLFAGTLITLDSRTATGSAPCTLDARRCSVPVNPRNPAQIRFDGGDYVVTSGGPVSIIHSQDPQNVFVGGSTEMISRQAVQNATAYYIPVGEDSYVTGGGAGGDYEPFKYVDIQIVSYEDGTQVLVESPSAGSVAFQLDRGQHYSSRGFIDGTAVPGITINAGTKISTSGPIGGMIFSAGNGTYLTDFFALLPDLLHSTDYVLATSGDNPGVGGAEPLNIYVFNPDPVNSLSVRYTDTAGTGTGTVGPGAVRDYQSLAGRYVPSGSTVRLTSNRNFWGVSAHDHKTVVSDWGYSWLASRFLTDTYTVPYAPGTNNPAVFFAARPVGCTGGTPAGTPTTLVSCNSTNRSPVWIAAARDNTRVKIDLDNDGIFDFVDTTGNDCPDNGQHFDSACAAPTTVCGVSLTNCVYEVDALQSLKVFDQTDYDNTGTFVTTNKPVAMAYGQDPDRGVTDDNSVDSGYVVFPISQSFLDPVLTLDKDGDRTSVPTGGTDAERTVRYTLTLKTWGFGPIENLTLFDTLPVGIPASAYVAGTTRITYPDLTQSLADPAQSTVLGRGRLTWALAPDQLGANQTLTVEYSVVIPAGPIALLENVARASGTYGDSTFSPSDTDEVVRTDVLLLKAATDDGALEAGDALTFIITVENTGSTNETNVVLTDPIPPDTVFCVGASDPPPCTAASSVSNAGPFTGAYSRSQNAVVWTAANFGAGTGPFELSFTVKVNPGVPVGAIVRNRADYESTQTPNFESNEVQPIVVGPRLVVTKARTSANAVVHPGEAITFELTVVNQGTRAATHVVIEDPILANTAYLPGSLSLRTNAGLFVAQTDASGDDDAAYDVLANEVRATVASLGAGAQVTLRFQSVVTGTSGSFASNSCIVHADNVNPVACTLIQIPIVGNATVTGLVWLDLDGDGVRDPDEPPLPNVSLIITNVDGVQFEVVTDSLGIYTAGVPAGLTDVSVVSDDPDIPEGALLTTANATQLDLDAIANATTPFADIGYNPPVMTANKTSDAGADLAPGQTVKYTITVDYRPSLTQTFRVTEYCVGNLSGTCGGGTWNAATATEPILTLAQNLASNYFVFVRGSAGDGTATGNTTPASDQLALSHAPAGTPGVGVAGGLTASGAANQIRFTRGSGAGTWSGVITVVECLGDCAQGGFTLRDVRRVVHTTTGVGPSTNTAPTGWTDLSRVALFGGFRGAGCDTADAQPQDHKSCQARFWPTGTNIINWTRDNGGATSLTTATSTVMVVEWGSEWTVQRANVTGAAGGNGIDIAGEYNVAAIAPVPRASTWVWGVGTTNDENIGESGESVALTLGSGVSNNAYEAQVAAGIEVGSNAVNFEVYALTHPGLAVDHQFKADGTEALTFDQAVAAADSSARFGLVYNTHHNPGNATATNDAFQNAWPRPMFAAFYTGNTTIRLERRRTSTTAANRAWTAWTQGIDLSGIRYTDTASLTNVGVSDTLPAGLTYEPGTTQVSIVSKTFRVTEYCVGPSAGGATCTPATAAAWNTTTGGATTLLPRLTLNQNLSSNYFVLVRGSAGGGGTTGNTTPASDSLSLTHAPAGTPGVGVAGGLTNSGAANQLRFQRGTGAAGTWSGVITVVECLGDCDQGGFRLRDVRRVAHTTTATTGTNTAATGWTDIDKVTLFGGFRGAGCDTADTDVVDHKSCQARFYPSGTNTINWTRDNGGATSLSTSTSAVMVVEWGAQWYVQRVNVTGNQGGDGINAANEYNTATISPVARANTWVWGGGTTNDENIGESGESVALTLGNGVSCNGTVACNAYESQVAAGIELNNNAVNFEVYALTHPDLAADHRFKTDGNGVDLFVDQTVAYSADSTARFALVYNTHHAPTSGTTGNDDYANAWPRPMFSARFLSGNGVRIERRRSSATGTNGNFAAWIQGLDFSKIRRVSSTVAGGAPPSLASGFTLDPGQSLVVTFTATVAANLDPSITVIANSATGTASGQPNVGTSVVTTVVRPAVDLEYNNADFALAGTSKLYQHIVYNVGNVADSYTLTAVADMGWTVELLDPVTLGVIARDTNGDGTWDGTAPNTGTLQPGEYREYLLRVVIPMATPSGTQHSVALTATSARSPSISDTATDETTVLTVGEFAPVMFLPDNSGVVRAGEKAWYAHRVFNNTGITETFDLGVVSELGWDTRFYYDSNGDGVYTDGVDIQINNTAALPHGSSQMIVVVTSAPGDATSGTRDVAHVTVQARTNSDYFAAGTDTTTVISGLLQLDLSGGGTRIVEPGVTGYAVYQGTVVNVLPSADTYEFSIGPATIYGADALDHPTELWIDTTGDGQADTLIAVDADGDGLWDTITSGYDPDSNGLPNSLVPLASGGVLAYELRRFVDPLFEQPRDAVTLQAQSVESLDYDNVTATMTLAALTRAPIAGLRIDRDGGVVEFATAFQRGTRGFVLYATNDANGKGARRQLNDELIRARRANAFGPTLYRFETGAIIRERFLVIEEKEIGGRTLVSGPFAAGDQAMAQAFDVIAHQFDGLGVAADAVRELPSGKRRDLQRARMEKHKKEWQRFSSAREQARARAEERRAARNARRVGLTDLVRVEVAGTGPVAVPTSELPTSWKAAPRIRVYRAGVEVASTVSGGAVRFDAVGLSTDYTDRDVYFISYGPRPPAPTAELSRIVPAAAAGAVRHEVQTYYLPSIAEGNDPWIWDYIGPGAWPWWDPTWGQFDLPGLVPSVGGSVRVEVRVVGDWGEHHRVSGALNGYPLGTLEFAGRQGAVLTAMVPASALGTTNNQLSLEYEGEGLALDWITLQGPAVRPPANATIVAIGEIDAEIELPNRTQYLIVSHPDFAAEAERLAEHKTSQGMRAEVVTTVEAYDRFSGGVFEPAAIRDLIRHARGVSRHLTHVLLIGDDTADPRDHAGYGIPAFVPSLLVHDGRFGLVPSENRFADVDGDGLPDVAIGRLPAQTVADAALMVDKVVAQQAALAAAAGRHLLAIDNDASDDTDFAGDAADLLARLPAGSEVLEVRLADGAVAARSALQAGWATGVSGVHYVGHGGVDIWADEQLLTLASVASLAPAPPAVVFTWGCSSQWFQWLDTPAVNEALLLLPGSGALATFGSAGYSTPVAQGELSTRLYDRLRQNGITLGEAIRLAKRDSFTEVPAIRRSIETFSLLGDPALKLQP